VQAPRLSKPSQYKSDHCVVLPQRLGRSHALDATVNCFLHSFAALSADRNRDSSFELSRYCNAISALRDELKTCPHSTDSETLCASLLLAQYEVLKPKDVCYSYVTLAGGVSAILKVCGPDRVTASEFEHAMFTAHYPTIIMHCLLRGEKCFLNDPQWLNAMRRASWEESPLISSLFCCLAMLADAMVEARQGRNASPPTCNEVLKTQLYKIRAQIVVHSELVVRSLSSARIYALYPKAYLGPHPVAQVSSQPKSESLAPSRAIKQATFYNACVIYVNIVLQELLADPNPALSLQTAQSASFIMSAMDFAKTTRPFGSWYMSLCGPLCYGVLSDTEKEICLRGMKDIFDSLNVAYDHTTLQAIFDMLTKGRPQASP
jgi:hypothetical protein